MVLVLVTLELLEQMLWEGSALPSLVNFAEMALGAGAITGLRERRREKTLTARPCLRGRLGAHQLSWRGPWRVLGRASGCLAWVGGQCWL